MAQNSSRKAVTAAKPQRPMSGNSPEIARQQTHNGQKAGRKTAENAAFPEEAGLSAAEDLPP